MSIPKDYSDSDGITNNFIDSFLSPLCSIFKGTYPCDLLPIISTKKRYCIIVNLSSSNKPGSHFISLYFIPKNNICVYFDSLGLPCFDKNIINHILFLKYKMIDPGIQIQDVTSKYCGFYCISFVLAMQMCIPVSQFILNFETNMLLKNDSKVEKYIIKQIKKIVIYLS